MCYPLRLSKAIATIRLFPSVRFITYEPYICSARERAESGELEDYALREPAWHDVWATYRNADHFVCLRFYIHISLTAVPKQDRARREREYSF
jgi:hypothetical protein